MVNGLRIVLATISLLITFFVSPFVFLWALFGFVDCSLMKCNNVGIFGLWGVLFLLIPINLTLYIAFLTQKKSIFFRLSLIPLLVLVIIMVLFPYKA